MPETRKLATIMSVDVAGYSRMAEASDSVAAEAVARLKEALARIAAPYAGRIFNTAGDGVMLEFPVASAGVHAALQLLNEAKAGERPLPQVRVGLHLGEVIVADNGDLLGHGVNVAARLQALAAPGTAMVSQAVHAQMRSASSIAFTPHGRVHLDKMAETMEVFTLAASGAKARTSVKLRMRQTLRPLVLATAAAVILLAATLFLLTRGVTTEIASTAVQNHTPRLAVLRFETLGDTESYFAGGIADELISEASRIPGLEVTARASSFALTGTRQTPANAAQELGATLVLTGAVRSTREVIRVNAQLSEASSGRLIWSRSFERPSGEAYALQRNIAVDVARAAGLRAIAGPTRQVDPEAFRLYLRAMEVWGRRTDAHVEEARDLFRAAADRDNEFADAWAWLARMEAVIVHNENYGPGPGHVFTPEMFAVALQHADRALARDPELAIPYQTRELVFTDLGRWHAAETAAVAAEARGGRGLLRVSTGRASAAIPALRKRTELNPLDQTEFAALSYACYMARDYPCALKAAQRALDLEPHYAEAAYDLFLCQLQTKDRLGARKTLDAYAGALRTWALADPDLRLMRALIGDGPGAPTSALLAMLDAGNAHLDDVVWTLTMTGRAREAAAVLTRWGPADRQYLNELFEPGLGELRATPQFWTVMEREGVLPFWRESGSWPDFCATERCPR